MSDDGYRPVERFMVMEAVYDSLADDELMLAAVEEHLRRDEWRARVVEADATPLDEEATVTRIPNMHYGWPMHYPNGEPVLDEDGAQVFDRVRFAIRAAGRVVRN